MRPLRPYDPQGPGQKILSGENNAVRNHFVPPTHPMHYLHRGENQLELAGEERDYP